MIFAVCQKNLEIAEHFYQNISSIQQINNVKALFTVIKRNLNLVSDNICNLTMKSWHHFKFIL